MINNNYTAETGVTEASLLKRVAVFLEDGEFDRADEYCERVLDINVENGEAYLYKLLATLRLKSKNELSQLETPFDDEPSYAKIMRFGNEKLKREIERFNSEIIKNQQEREKALSYERATQLLESNSIKELTEAYSVFTQLNDFNNASEKAEFCKSRIESIYDAEYNTLYLSAKEKEQEINDREYLNSTDIIEKDDYDQYIKDSQSKKVFDYSLLVAVGIVLLGISAIFLSVSEYLSLAGITFKTVLRCIFTKIVPGMPLTGISAVISFRISKKLVKKQRANLIEDISTAAQKAKEISEKINNIENETFALKKELDEKLDALKHLNEQYDAFIEKTKTLQ